MPSDDAAYREASFARSQDSMTQPPTYSRLAAHSTTGRHVQMSAPSKSRMAPQSSAGSFASVARSEASFVSSIGGSRNKEQALADTYARACARLRALEVCALQYLHVHVHGTVSTAVDSMLHCCCVRYPRLQVCCQ